VATVETTIDETGAASRLLDLVPVPNAAARVAVEGEGLIVWLPIRKTWWMTGPLGKVLPFRHEKGFALDAIGREVFESCDGKRNVESIVEAFAERHRLRFAEARASVTHFLKTLVQRKVVVLALLTEETK
jgi:hypothetical protein